MRQAGGFPDVYAYDDYRRFLRDSYQFLKCHRRGFSFRQFSKTAGFSSPNFVKLVMEGQRNLSLVSIARVAKALKLSREAALFFEALVQFNQSTTGDDKNLFFDQLSRFRKFREIRQVERDQYEYYSHWYYSAIRELVTLKDFCEDESWISKRVFPPIRSSEAKEALACLIRLGFLVRDAKGRLQQQDATISTGKEVRELAVSKFHEQMLERAIYALKEIPTDERDFGSVTLGIEKSQIPLLKEKIYRFRRELLADIGALRQSNDEVYQLGVQLFPLSRTKAE